MGTRADFYVGKGAEAEWIGSIGWDGYRGGIDDAVLTAHSEKEYRAAVAKFFADRDDVTLPDQGWPWPWDDSGTSDCSYWFFGGRCWDACWYAPGEYRYAPCDKPEPDWGADGASEEEQFREWLNDSEAVIYPDMSARKNVTFGNRSGLIVVAGT